MERKRKDGSMNNSGEQRIDYEEMPDDDFVKLVCDLTGKQAGDVSLIFMHLRESKGSTGIKARRIIMMMIDLYRWQVEWGNPEFSYILTNTLDVVSKRRNQTTV